MKYNFDQVVDRSGSHCVKLEAMKTKYHMSENGIPMWIADMDFPVAKEIQDAILQRARHPIYGYTQKPEGFLDAIREWYGSRTGAQFEREAIFFTPGVVAGVTAAVLALTQKGDRIALLTPSYYPFFNCIGATSRELAESRLIDVNGRFEIDWESLEKALSRSKAMILCSPHNPVGRVWTREELERIAALCKKYDVLMISDEIHSDLIFKGYKHIPTMTVNDDMRERTVYFVSCSKTFNLAGLSTGIMIVPGQRLRPLIKAKLDELHMGTNLFGMEAGWAAYKHGADWLDQVLEYIEGNYNYMVDYFARELPQVTVTKMEGTYLAWINFTRLTRDDKLVARLVEEEQEVAGEVGTTFGECGAGYYRLNLATNRCNVEECCRRIKKAMETLVK